MNKCENILKKMIIFLLAISVVTFSLAEKVKANEQMVSKKAKGKILGYVLGESYFNSSYMQAKIGVDNGEPINSAKLKLKSNLDKMKKTTSDSDGYFEFRNLKKGKYTIIVTKKGYDKAKKKVKLKNGEEKSLEIEMEEKREIEEEQCDVTGTWKGSLTSSVGTYSITLNLTETGNNKVKGNGWTSYGHSLSIEGKKRNQTLMLTIDSKLNGSCRGDWSATLQINKKCNKMSFDYYGSDCEGEDSGSGNVSLK